MKCKILILMTCVALLGFFMRPASAVTVDYTFEYISGDVNNSMSLTHMLVTDDFSGITVPPGFTADVGFKFTTTSPGFITDIGFYDGTILSGRPSALVQSSQVNFILPDPPIDIPGQNSYFQGTAAVFYSADATNPAPKWGVSAGEYLWILFDLDTGKTAQDVINALNLAITNHGPYSDSNPFPYGGLAVAIKIQGLPESTEGVNNVVPIPPSALLLGSGLLGLLGWRRFRKN